MRIFQEMLYGAMAGVAVVVSLILTISFALYVITWVALWLGPLAGSVVIFLLLGGVFGALVSQMDL